MCRGGLNVHTNKVRTTRQRPANGRPIRVDGVRKVRVGAYCFCMARDWETWLSNGTGPASPTEDDARDRTERRIRDAIAADSRLAGKVKVEAKGSYAARTNVKTDADVDVAVRWNEWSFVEHAFDAEGKTPEQLGYTAFDVNPGPDPAEFRRWVEEAMREAFGWEVDTTGSKAIFVPASKTTRDADVVPCFSNQRYEAPHRSVTGIRLYPKNSWTHILNWPAQNLKNGTTKNTATGRNYKRTVRALKRLKLDMKNTGRFTTELGGFVIESLAYNVPNAKFTASSSWKQTVLSVLAALWEGFEDGSWEKWVEVNELEWLYTGQARSPQDAKAWVYSAWNYVNGN